MDAFREPYRQGDVLLIPINLSSTAGLTRVERDDRNRIVLAEGETTGHAHAILDADAELFRQSDLDEMADRFLRVEETVALVHEEHGTIDVAAGDYIVRRKREYHPEEIRYVYD